MSVINVIEHYKPEIFTLLKNAKQEKDKSALDRGIYLLSSVGADSEYTDMLLSLLKEEWHIEQENIVSILEEIKDPRSIDTLYEVALNIPEYDEMRGLAKKCMWALWAINTPEAINRILLLSTSDDPIIKENAINLIESIKK